MNFILYKKILIFVWPIWEKRIRNAVEALAQWGIVPNCSVTQTFLFEASSSPLSINQFFFCETILDYFCPWHVHCIVCFICRGRDNSSGMRDDPYEISLAENLFTAVFLLYWWTNIYKITREKSSLGFMKSIASLFYWMLIIVKKLQLRTHYCYYSLYFIEYIFTSTNITWEKLLSPGSNR